MFEHDGTDAAEAESPSTSSPSSAGQARDDWTTMYFSGSRSRLQKISQPWLDPGSPGSQSLLPTVVPVVLVVRVEGAVNMAKAGTWGPGRAFAVVTIALPPPPPLPSQPEPQFPFPTSAAGAAGAAAAVAATPLTPTDEPPPAVLSVVAPTAYSWQQQRTAVLPEATLHPLWAEDLAFDVTAHAAPFVAAAVAAAAEASAAKALMKPAGGIVRISRSEGSTADARGALAGGTTGTSTLEPEEAAAAAEAKVSAAAVAEAEAEAAAVAATEAAVGAFLARVGVRVEVWHAGDRDGSGNAGEDLVACVDMSAATPLAAGALLHGSSGGPPRRNLRRSSSVGFLPPGTDGGAVGVDSGSGSGGGGGSDGAAAAEVDQQCSIDAVDDASLIGAATALSPRGSPGLRRHSAAPAIEAGSRRGTAVDAATAAADAASAAALEGFAEVVPYAALAPTLNPRVFSLRHGPGKQMGQQVWAQLPPNRPATTTSRESTCGGGSIDIVGSAAALGAAAAAARVLNQKRVLVADDSDSTRKLISRSFRHSGYEVDMVENGAEALKLMKAHRYAVVFLDLDMPVMSGFSCTAAFRTWERSPGGGNLQAKEAAQVICVLSGHSGDRELALCDEVGVDWFERKPVKLPTLRKIATIAAARMRNGGGAAIDTMPTALGSFTAASGTAGDGDDAAAADAGGTDKGAAAAVSAALLSSAGALGARGVLVDVAMATGGGAWDVGTGAAQDMPPRPPAWAGSGRGRGGGRASGARGAAATGRPASFVKIGAVAFMAP